MRNDTNQRGRPYARCRTVNNVREPDFIVANERKSVSFCTGHVLVVVVGCANYKNVGTEYTKKEGTNFCCCCC